MDPMQGFLDGLGNIYFMKTLSVPDLYFKDPRFEFGSLEVFIFKTVSYSFTIALFLSAVLFLFSGTPFLFWLSLFLFLYLIHRFLHGREADMAFRDARDTSFNVALFITPLVFRYLHYAYRKSLILRKPFYLVLMNELLKRKEVDFVLRRLEVDYKTFFQAVQNALHGAPSTVLRDDIYSALERLVLQSFYMGKLLQEESVTLRTLIAALPLVVDSHILRVFEQFAIFPTDFRDVIHYLPGTTLFGRRREYPVVVHEGGFVLGLSGNYMNRALTARPTPNLDQFSVDITEVVRREGGGILVGHEKEFQRLMEVISGLGSLNALLVGEPGVGKTSLVRHLAYLMIQDQVPSMFFDKRFVSLSLGALLAKAQLGELSARLQDIAREIVTAGNIVLHIPDFHSFFLTAQDETALTAAQLFLPILQDQSIPVIAETQPAEFKRYIESRSDFLELFSVIPIQGMSEEEAILFLSFASIAIESRLRTFITFRAVQSAVQFARRYISRAVLPGAALQLLRRACSYAQERGLSHVTAQEVALVIEEQTGIPVREASAQETEKLLRLEDYIHERFINQDDAVRLVANALREYRSGLSRSRGPIASFLFVGPTGVGKTELAKILAEVQFGSRDQMHRFDMSEYQDSQSIFRFIGTPDGKISGALTDAVSHMPYALVLLDEIEKAHLDVLNLFLQVLDEGRLTDGRGFTVDFTHTIIIATSNAHSELIKQKIEQGISIGEFQQEFRSALTDIFKPELLNRFSRIVIFRSLDVQELARVTSLLLQEVSNSLFETHGVHLSFADRAVQLLAQLGYDPVFGARPLRQVISDRIKDPLARKILQREFARGDGLTVDIRGRGFTFRVN